MHLTKLTKIFYRTAQVLSPGTSENQLPKDREKFSLTPEELYTVNRACIFLQTTPIQSGNLFTENYLLDALNSINKSLGAGNALSIRQAEHAKAQLRTTNYYNVLQENGLFEPIAKILDRYIQGY